jgi:uncharacterized membrane protein YjjP (DUF1212 family)
MINMGDHSYVTNGMLVFRVMHILACIVGLLVSEISTRHTLFPSLCSVLGCFTVIFLAFLYFQRSSTNFG